MYISVYIFMVFMCVYTRAYICVCVYAVVLNMLWNLIFRTKLRSTGEEAIKSCATLQDLLISITSGLLK